MDYPTNYTNRATIFDNGDAIEGHHIRALYDELGVRPSERLMPAKITVSATPPAGAQVGDLWIDTSVVLP